MTILPWFEQPLARLAAAVQAERLPHALLLSVPEGWGSESFLANITSLVLGRGPREGQPLQEFADPDFHWVRSIDKDGETSIVIQIDAIRALNDFVTTKVFQGRHKLVIIPQAHRMNANAANALLKTLEEPVSLTCLVLESSQAGRLLPTLRSRCQRLSLGFPRRQAEAWLKQEGQMDAIAMLDLVGGGPFAAIELARVQENGIGPVLQQLKTDRGRIVVLDQIARADGLPDLLRQWYRFALRRLSCAVNPTERISLLAFVDELIDCIRQIDGVKGANTRLLLDRLALLWVVADTS